jgi:hypothetical protein
VGSDWYVNYGCKNVKIPASHTCHAEGSAVNGIYPIQCADIVVSNDDTTDPPTYPFAEIWGQGEFLCQNPNGAAVQCGGMNVNVGMSYAEVLAGHVGVGTTEPSRNYKCSSSPGPACPASGRAFVPSVHATFLDNGVCWQVYTWLPVGEVIAIDGVARHSTHELDSPTALTVCFTQRTF